MATLSEIVSDLMLKINKPHVENSAAAHNGVYRGKDITSRHHDGSLSRQIQAGDFDDLFIGDYITMPTTANNNTVTTNWRIADFDYYLRTSDQTELTQHHVVLVPDACLFTAVMNDTNTTVGAWTGSKMYKTYIPMCNAAIKTAFGASHVISYRSLLSTSMNANAPSAFGAGWTGASSDWAWTTVECADLMSEPQVYGGTICSSSGYDAGIKTMQFSLFRLNRALMHQRSDFWLSSVASSGHFCFVAWGGLAGAWSASNSLGVRPHFLYH